MVGCYRSTAQHSTAQHSVLSCSAAFYRACFIYFRSLCFNIEGFFYPQPHLWGCKKPCAPPEMAPVSSSSGSSCNSSSYSSRSSSSSSSSSRSSTSGDWYDISNIGFIAVTQTLGLKLLVGRMCSCWARGVPQGWYSLKHSLQKLDLQSAQPLVASRAWGGLQKPHRMATLPRLTVWRYLQCRGRADPLNHKTINKGRKEGHKEERNKKYIYKKIAK